MGLGACSKRRDPVGVEECDAYVAKFEACLDDLPDDERERRAPEAESQRKVMRAIAQRPDARATLAASCRAALAALTECR